MRQTSDLQYAELGNVTECNVRISLFFLQQQWQLHWITTCVSNHVHNTCQNFSNKAINDSRLYPCWNHSPEQHLVKKIIKSSQTTIHCWSTFEFKLKTFNWYMKHHIVFNILHCSQWMTKQQSQVMYRKFCEVWTCGFQISRTTHTHTRLMALCPGLPGWAGTRKVKPIWM